MLLALHNLAQRGQHLIPAMSFALTPGVPGAQRCAQVLLTLDNLAQRGQYLNASNTFRELFAYGTVPVVNENDTVAVEELRIGDNDTLSAQARHV